MHLLTVIRGTDTATVAAVPYDDFDEAHRALMSHVIADDLYLHADSPMPVNVAKFTLVNVDERDELTRRPRVVGTATIAPFVGGPIESPRCCARNAQQWMSDHGVPGATAVATNPAPACPWPCCTRPEPKAAACSPPEPPTPRSPSSRVSATTRPTPHQRTFDRLRRVAVDLACTIRHCLRTPSLGEA